MIQINPNNILIVNHSSLTKNNPIAKVARPIAEEIIING